MTEVYRIGVSIAMTSNAGEVFGAIARGLLGLRRQAKALESDLESVRASAHGGMAAIAGAAALRSMAALVNHAKELNHELALMKSAGMPNFSIAAASATARKVALRVPGSTASSNTRSLRELRMTLGASDEAAAARPSLARAAVVLSSATDRSRVDAIQMLAQGLELRGGITNSAAGQISAPKFGNDLNLASKAIVAHGSSAEMGGFRAGPALSAAGRTLNGGIVQPGNAKEMGRLGLIAPSKVRTTRSGRVVTDPHLLIGEDILNRSDGLFAWVKEILQPRLEKMPLPDLKADGLGPALDEDLNPARHAELYRLASSQGFGSLPSLILQQEQLVLRDQHLFEKAAGLRVSPQLVGAAPPRDGRRDSNSHGVPLGNRIYSDPTSQVVTFEAAWENLLTTLGSPLVNDATGLLGTLTTRLSTLAAFTASYPNLIGGLEEIGVVLAGFAAIGGSLAVLNSGLRMLGGSLPTFAAGGAAGRGFATLTGAGGLIALAVGIETLGNSLGHIPKWTVDGLTGVRVRASAGGLPDAAFGAVVGGIARAAVGDVARHLSKGASLISPNSAGKPYEPPIVLGSGAFTSPAAPPPAAAPSAPPAKQSSPIQREFHETPAPAPGTMNVHNIAAVYLDGHAVGQMIFKRAGDHATLPPASGTGYDPSMTPTFTAHLIGNA